MILKCYFILNFMKIKFNDLIKSLLFITVLTIFNSCNVGRFQGFSSHDGSLVLIVENHNGMLTYSLSKNEKIIIEIVAIRQNITNLFFNEI